MINTEFHCILIGICVLPFVFAIKRFQDKSNVLRNNIQEISLEVSTKDGDNQIQVLKTICSC